MMILFVILVVLASVILGFFVLVQNPKGGGLSGSIAGFNNQFMGVKQTNDVLEKGTWAFAIIIGLLCLCSTVFIAPGAGSRNGPADQLDTKPKQTQTATPPPPPGQNQTAPKKP